LRPLLEIDRSELLAYARECGLRWIEDASNADTGFDRNYLRHRIVPLLRERWPAVVPNLARSARLCAEAAGLLDAEADADLAGIATRRPDGLDIPALRELDECRQRNALRRWLRRLGLPVPGSRRLNHILRDVLAAGRDRQPCIRWPGCEVRRYRGVLYAMPPLAPHDSRQVFLWGPEMAGYRPLDLPSLGQLRMQETRGAGLRAAILAGTSLIVRFRRGGERFHPAGRSHGQELKKLLQDAGIPPWERDRLPLLCLDEKVLAVVGLGIAAAASAAPGETGLLPVFDPVGHCAAERCGNFPVDDNHLN